MSKVLIVDNDDEALKMLETMLKHEGFETVSFTSGMDALVYLESAGKAPDAVILDLSMPVMDGLTVAEEIRNNEQIHPDKKPVHLAFFTARNIDAPIMRVAERNNVERIFQKARDIVSLPEQLKEWLNA